MNFDEMNLTQLKAEAKTRGIKGYSKMNKSELLYVLTPESKPESFIDGIRAAIRNAREERSRKGRAAGNAVPKTKQSLARKAQVYTADRNGGSLSARQERRMRKAFRQGAQPS